ncbi:MAG: ECF-type sigma factor [Planctomycetota bacterium]|nr:ECF-type sigma factor [Planctomycetota bacterium]MDA0933119.1 ECF-type sigma factor [Planctomycetota bacterium]
MVTTPNPPITALLADLQAGDEDAREAVAGWLYPRLREMAGTEMARQQRQITVQPTVLVHEAWLRLCQGTERDYSCRRHFLKLAGCVIRHVLVDAARSRQRRPRSPGGDQGLELAIGPLPSDVVDVLDLQAALERLAARDPELERIVELRFFAGLTLEETGEVLDRSTTSVHRAWQLARAMLIRDLQSSRSDPL